MSFGRSVPCEPSEKTSFSWWWLLSLIAPPSNAWIRALVLDHPRVYPNLNGEPTWRLGRTRRGKERKGQTARSSSSSSSQVLYDSGPVVVVLCPNQHRSRWIGPSRIRSVILVLHHQCVRACVSKDFFSFFRFRPDRHPLVERLERCKMTRISTTCLPACLPACTHIHNAFSHSHKHTHSFPFPCS